MNDSFEDIDLLSNLDESCQQNLDLLDLLEAIEGIRKGLDDVKNKRTISLEEFEQNLRQQTE